MFHPLRKAVAYYGVHANTLRKWADEGRIESRRTPSGQRLFKLLPFSSDRQRRRVIYCRVSSASQKSDLESQVASLKQQFPDHELIQDIGSGLNWKRKGFNALLESVMLGVVAEIVVAHKDRLCRFGFELLECVASKHNTRIVVLNDTGLSPQEELVRDLISIIRVFSCRIYGMRKYASQVSQDQSLPKCKRSSKST